MWIKHLQAWGSQIVPSFQAVGDPLLFVGFERIVISFGIAFQGLGIPTAIGTYSSSFPIRNVGEKNNKQGGFICVARYLKNVSLGAFAFVQEFS